MKTIAEFGTLEARAKRLAYQSVGKAFTGRFHRIGGFEFSGVIVECAVDGIRERGRSVVVQFRVTVEGPTGRRETGLFERLPR